MKKECSECEVEFSFTKKDIKEKEQELDEWIDTDFDNIRESSEGFFHSTPALWRKTKKYKTALYKTKYLICPICEEEIILNSKEIKTIKIHSVKTLMEM